MPLRLAELARVPEENRDGFWLAVFDAVLDAWEHDASSKMAVSLKPWTATPGSPPSVLPSPARASRWNCPTSPPASRTFIPCLV